MDTYPSEHCLQPGDAAGGEKGDMVNMDASQTSRRRRRQQQQNGPGLYFIG